MQAAPGKSLKSLPFFLYMDCVRQTELKQGFFSRTAERRWWVGSKGQPLTASLVQTNTHGLAAFHEAALTNLLINISVQFVSPCAYAQLSNDFAEVHKRALALMNSCCQRRRGSGTVRAPRGCSDRFCFCITLNPKVRGINLTLLWETKESPLTW